MTEQPESRGTGPTLERRYYVELTRPRLGPADLMRQVQDHLPDFSPETLADFHPQQPEAGGLRLGDEFYIDILGPWNGGVRVTELGPTRFELTTLAGHPEAGRICFAAYRPDDRPDELHFEIHSWARVRDGTVNLLYDQLGGGRLMQEATWVEFCRRVAQASGGQALGPIRVETIRREPGKPTQQTLHEH